MGWSGYDLYDGDGTFSFQLLLLEKAGVSKKNIYEDDIADNCPTCGAEINRKTNAYNDQLTIKLSQEDKKIVRKAYTKLIKYLKVKAPKNLVDMEYWSIHWQMFADLLINNKLPMTKQIKTLATTANNWLSTDAHCGDFNEPKERRDCVKSFGRELKSYKL